METRSGEREAARERQREPGRVGERTMTTFVANAP